MNQVDISIEQLIEAIRQSDEYLCYQEMREKIHAEPEKECAIHEFRRRNYALQNNKENRDIYIETDYLEQEYALLLKDPLVDEFLSTELAFCRLVQNMNWKIMESLDFEF